MSFARNSYMNRQMYIPCEADVAVILQKKNIEKQHLQLPYMLIQRVL